MAFYQKYRSKLFSDLIGQDRIRDTLVEAIKSDKLSHAYLLTGPRGTGKTSTARLLAKAMNCLTLKDLRGKRQEISGEPCNTCSSCLEIGSGRSVDVIEIDAASHTGVEEIRELIEKAGYAPNQYSKKVYIIDEVHMLSKSAFNALLKTLEEPPKHVAFILATTEAHKLPATILSRVQRYDFRRVSKEDIIKNLNKIVREEKIEISNDSLELIASNAEGGHRDAIVLLEKVTSLGKKLDKSQVENMLGVADRKFIFQFLGAIFSENPEEGLKIAHRLYEDGLEMAQFNKDVIEILRRMLLLVESGKALFEDTTENIRIIDGLCQKTNTEQILKLIDIFLKSNELLKDVAYPILPVEMAVIESCEQLSITNPKLETQNPKQIQNSNVQNQKPDSAIIQAPVSSSGRQSHGPGIQDSAKGLLVDSPLQGNDNSISGNDSEKGKNTRTSEVIQTLPTPNSELPANSVPIIVLQMTDDVWSKALVAIKKENNSLAALLRSAKPLEYTSGKLILGAKFKFHKDKISETTNTNILEKVFSDLTGEKCIVVCKLADSKLSNSEKITDHKELQKAAEEIFS